MQKLLSLIRSHWFIFVFITLGGGVEKILLQFMSESVLPMFSSKSFIVSCLVFKCLSHFEFLLCMGGCVLSSLIYMRLSNFFPAPLAEETVFFPMDILSFFCQRIIDCKSVGLSLNCVLFH